MLKRVSQAMGFWWQAKLEAWGVTCAWLGLAEKDRRALKGLAGALILAIGYLFFWTPIEVAQQQADKRLAAAEADWLWLNQQLPKLADQQAQIPQVELRSQAQLTQYVQKMLRQLNLVKQMSAIKPQSIKGRQGVQVQFEKVMAPRFFRWLQTLEQQGLVAEKLSVKPIDQQAGWIQVQVTYVLPKK